ncbi:DUF2399 domain-containing protein [Streptomyces yaanensis]|uniref:DUF2399 domain-containing protein n=1 Tax=Streptomyces yaanensis TaxID=1142239 RepID=A0ABV7S6P6_9ACTN|nr:DUF2399 domain-containing protein [Streptomyces sp. CGMCC 4.7035]WNB99685.1 DUF2399 domain-containing protein [Streptomyces sp. CGMCC 4.7035]
MENPSILALSFHRFGPGCPPLVCTSGRPNSGPTTSPSRRPRRRGAALRGRPRTTRPKGSLHYERPMWSRGLGPCIARRGEPSMGVPPLRRNQQPCEQVSKYCRRDALGLDLRAVDGQSPVLRRDGPVLLS